MGHRWILEGAYDQEQGVGLLEGIQKLAAYPAGFTWPLGSAGKVYVVHLDWYDALGVEHSRHGVQASVGDLGYSKIGFGRDLGLGDGLGPASGKGVEDGGLTTFGQPNDP